MCHVSCLSAWMHLQERGKVKRKRSESTLGTLIVRCSFGEIEAGKNCVYEDLGKAELQQISGICFVVHLNENLPLSSRLDFTHFGRRELCRSRGHDNVRRIQTRWMLTRWLRHFLHTHTLSPPSPLCSRLSSTTIRGSTSRRVTYFIFCQAIQPLSPFSTSVLRRLNFITQLINEK